MNKPQVFLTYSRVDAHWAHSFAKALRERGVSVWLDELQITADESEWDAMKERLRESDVLVTVVDPTSSLERTSLIELGAAIVLGKSIVPIVPQEFDPSKLGLDLRTRHSLLRDSPEDTADKLAHSLKAA